jgi:Zn-dependent protease
MRIAGIDVGANWTWLIALGYLVLVLSGDYKVMLGADRQEAAFAFAVGVSLLFFASIVLHELGHAIVARRNGIGILGIELWMLGGLASFDRDTDSPGVEFRVSAAGPLVTGLVAAACLGAAFAWDADGAREALSFVSEPGADPWLASLTWLGLVNGVLLAFNLVPAYPLDGGRILRAVAWKVTGDRRRATLFAGHLGRVFGWLLIGYGLLLLFSGNGSLAGVFFVFMGMMLTQSARGAIAGGGRFHEALELTVADVMDRDPVAVPSTASVARALDEFFWRYRWPWFPVVDPAGHFVGLVEQAQVEAVPEEERQARSVADLVDPDRARASTVSDSTPLTALLTNNRLQSAGALMAVDEAGLLSGVVTIDNAKRAFSEAVRRIAGDGDDDGSARTA